MNITETIQYWIDSSDQDFIAMEHLYDAGDFSWSLFLGHIVIEKLLKAYFITSNKENPPFIHDLLRIAERANLKLDEEKMDFLDTVTAFNIRTRYDDYINDFKKKCTHEFTEKYILEIKEFRRWIKTKL
ncbi:MAG: HEPN domain-containing protein [Spirochaetales bacterium]|nr:HEPN domain-containing protein [Spirochaetales bacterium]